MTKVSILIAIITLLSLSLSMLTVTAHPDPVEKSSEYEGQKVKTKKSSSIRKFLNRLPLSASHDHDVHSLEKGSEHAHKAETEAFSPISFFRRLKQKQKKTKKNEEDEEE